MGPVQICHLMMFETFHEAKAAKRQILEQCASCDQLNVVIREEGNMEDAELLGIDKRVKVFAGKAWATIHERRQQEAWYPG